MTQQKRPLTLRDVSEASGVSEMTVSRVLRNRGDVSAATRAKVLSATKLLGYVPNKIAGALASQRVNLVAVIIPSLSNMVFPEVMTGISDALDNTELQPVVGVTNYLPEREEKVLYEMLSWRPSGVIIAGLEQSETSRAMLINSGIPVVQIMDIDGDPIDAMVGISHRRAGVEIMDQEFYTGGSALAKGREMTSAMLERSPELDFMYYSNDMIGAGGLLHLREKGIEIPRQMGLAGFNKVELIDGLPQKLATMDSCRFEIGQMAAQIIASRNDASLEPMKNIIELSPKIAYGDTLRRK